jgi:hypothetical protein
MFYSQVNWILKKRDSLKVPMVLHVGDIVNFNNTDHWEVASKGFDILDRVRVPYALAVGNHDTEAVGEFSGSAAPGNTNQNLRRTSFFNEYFPVQRFTNQRGRYEEGKSDNAYYTFKEGDTNWMILTMEFCPRLGVLNWAEDVIRRYYMYNVIILTHYYLTPKSTIADRNAGYGDFSPQDIFQRVASKYPNVLLVLSGHVTKSAFRVDTGTAGNKIYQILQNYQDEDFGGGYLRLLSIDVDKKTISGKMYSPYYDKVRSDSSTFEFKDVQFLKARSFYKK